MDNQNQPLEAAGVSGIMTPSGPSKVNKSSPASDVKDPELELEIKNLENTPNMQKDETKPSPSLQDVDLEKGYGHRYSSSTGNIPDDFNDPDERLGHGRKYSLDLLPPNTAQNNAALAMESEQRRKRSETYFKIIIALVVFGTLFSISALTVAWEMGYFNKENGFNSPVFY